MPWEVLYTEQAADWVTGLDDDARRHVLAAVELLAEHGPQLGRPLVDTIKGSRHRHMKELRASTLRALFAFDPDRRAIILLGGDKRGDWKGWYKRNIPLADALYDDYLAGR
ncbi:MAG TPA: type II toxin-antitoxin system RelE/ParE family toxin [Conexibacter sp.]